MVKFFIITFSVYFTLVVIKSLLGRIEMIQYTDVDTFVFFDLETTGLWQNGQSPEITQLAMVACSRDEFGSGTVNIISKLNLYFNPIIPIEMVASQITGLDNVILKDCNTFDEDAIELIHLFLKRLKRPALFAHNGVNLDFPLLLKMVKKFSQDQGPLLTIPCLDTLPIFRSMRMGGSGYISCKLDDIYKRLFKSNQINHHNAEVDSIMLMDCCRYYSTKFLYETFKELNKFEK